jgi:hypothetical protein
MDKLQESVNKIVRSEMDKLIKEAKERAPDVEKKLEELRKKLIPEMKKDVDESMGIGAVWRRRERRIEMKTVSDLLEIPVNELMLHFLNNVKTKNERSLVEYHLGAIYFYEDA